MITAFGKYCRNLRMDRGELLKEMAERLCVTPAYLSAVENGKRNIPRPWVDSIISNYQLDLSEQLKLKEAVKCSVDEVKVALGNGSNKAREVAFSFAREFKDLSEDEFDAISDILKKNRND